MMRPAAGRISRLVKFTGVGALGFPINLGVFAVVDVFAPYLAAAVAAWFVAASFNFVANWWWTFDRPPRPMRRYPRALAVRATGGLISLGALWVLVEVGGAIPIVAQGTAIAIGFAVNYIGAEVWTFAASMTQDPLVSAERDPE